MPPVFAHGRLRLYLLRLLDEAPRHGYEVIRLLEERFQGLYAPSAGTVYPRLAKLEAEGLVTHSTEGGRKIYAITDAGRAELVERQGELAELELEIRESLASLAADIREDVSGSARDLRHEMREQAQSARGTRRARGGPSGGQGEDPHGARPHGEQEAWRRAREEMKRAKQEWKEQSRRAQEDARKARQQADKEREAHAEAMQEMQRIARRVQDEVRDQARAGDWQGAVQSGLSELGRHIGDLGRIAGHTTPWPGHPRSEPRRPSGAPAPEDRPDWAEEEPSTDPARDLERLLDRFRDDVRDAARDRGVTDEQFREARRHLATAAAHVAALLRRPQGPL
jgi:DNA-binding PadR family transcriptional regulator